MEAFTVTILVVYVLGIVLTLSYNAMMWNDLKDLGWDEDDEDVKLHARQTLLSPLWPRYLWPWIKRLPTDVKNFFVKVLQLTKDAF